MKKKIACSLFTSLVFVLVMAATAFAKVPGNSFIFGNQAFDQALLFNSSYVPTINTALANANGIMYYNLDGGTTFYDLMTGSEVTSEQLSQLPEITYWDSNGNKTLYQAGDGDPIVPSTADVTVTISPAIASFKQIKVSQTDVSGATKFTVNVPGAGTASIGSSLTVNTSANSVTLNILDASGKVLKSGSLDISNSGNSTIQF